MRLKFFLIFYLVICIGLLGCIGGSSLKSMVEDCNNGDLKSCLEYLRLHDQKKISQEASNFDQILSQAAKLGNVDAMFNLAVRATQPQTNPLNIDLAIHWFSRASSAGDSLSSLNLGLIYDHGIGVKPDYVKARHWYKKAADSGDPEGLFNLAVYLDEGLGGNIDKHAAARAYMLASQRGHARSAYNLALMLGRGEGIDKNWESAIKMLRYSYELGYEPAKQLLKKWSKIE